MPSGGVPGGVTPAFAFFCLASSDFRFGPARDPTIFPMPSKIVPLLFLGSGFPSSLALAAAAALAAASSSSFFSSWRKGTSSATALKSAVPMTSSNLVRCSWYMARH